MARYDWLACISSSDLIPSKYVRVVPAQKNENRWSIPFTSGRAGTIPEARIALTSEPQSSHPSRSA